METFDEQQKILAERITAGMNAISTAFRAIGETIQQIQYTVKTICAIYKISGMIMWYTIDRTIGMVVDDVTGTVWIIRRNVITGHLGITPLRFRAWLTE